MHRANRRDSARIANLGSCYGKEVVQLYVGHKGGRVVRPPKDADTAARAAITPEMQRRMDEEAPLRSLRACRGYTQVQLDALIAQLNALL